MIKNENNKVSLGYLLIILTFLFKLSAAPFHNWAPDLYDNLNIKITNWMMIIPKITIVFFLFLIYKEQISPYFDLSFIFLFFGISSLIVGSFALFTQIKLIRFLAYSSISHIGFLLLGLYTNDYHSYLIYIIIYGLTTLNIFIILSISSSIKTKYLTDLYGFFKFNPYLAFAFIINLLSLAGVCLLKNL